MQRLGHLSAEDFSRRLVRGELALHVGPYIYKIQSNVRTVAAGLEALYPDFQLAESHEFVDFNIAILRHGLRHRIRGEAEFLFDGRSPFDTIPTGQAYAFLEWGMNWCVSLHTNEYLKLHAAAVSRGNTAIIMPGVPGAGKSTLCAALGLSGWRILSDEHAMIPPDTAEVVPLCRPVSLKNESIAVIKDFSSSALFGPVSKKTHKGVVAHMKADMHTSSHDAKNLQARAMVFPRYSREETQLLSPRQRTDSFILAAYHSFNYSLLCDAGFEAMKTLIENVDCYDLVYHDLEWAVNAINGLPGIPVAE
jgi:HprK-related kinase A